MSITDFLNARIAEDEALARAAFSGQADPENGWGEQGRAVTPHVGVIHEDIQRAHVVKWDPARVLAECAAKRAIVEEHVNEGEPFDMAYCSVCMDRWRKDLLAYPCPTIAALAAVYADHDDYQDEWKVGA